MPYGPPSLRRPGIMIGHDGLNYGPATALGCARSGARPSIDLGTLFLAGGVYAARHVLVARDVRTRVP